MAGAVSWCRNSYSVLVKGYEENAIPLVALMLSLVSSTSHAVFCKERWYAVRVSRTTQITPSTIYVRKLAGRGYSLAVGAPDLYQSLLLLGMDKGYGDLILGESDDRVNLGSGVEPAHKL